MLIVLFVSFFELLDSTGRINILLFSGEEWSRTCTSVGYPRSVLEDQLPNLADLAGLDMSDTALGVDDFHDAFLVEEVSCGGW